MKCVSTYPSNTPQTQTLCPTSQENSLVSFKGIPAPSRVFGCFSKKRAIEPSLHYPLFKFTVSKSGNPHFEPPSPGNECFFLLIFLNQNGDDFKGKSPAGQGKHLPCGNSQPAMPKLPTHRSKRTSGR